MRITAYRFQSDDELPTEDIDYYHLIHAGRDEETGKYKYHRNTNYLTPEYIELLKERVGLEFVERMNYEVNQS